MLHLSRMYGVGYGHLRSIHEASMARGGECMRGGEAAFGIKWADNGGEGVVFYELESGFHRRVYTDSMP